MKILDISNYQPNVDYAKVAAVVDGVILRAGMRYWGSLQLDKDECFETHYTGFRKAGLPVGAYFYSAAATLAQAKEEAEYFAQLLAGKRLDLPVYFDIENSERQGALSKSTMTALVKTFCTTMESKGFFCGYYSYTAWLKTKFDSAALSNYTLWKADYRTQYDTTLACDMHQYTSDGVVDGIAGRVDLSNCTRDFPAIIQKAGLNGCSEAQIGTAVMLFNGRNEVPFWYSVYNARRSTHIHRGIDVRGLDSDIILCPVSGTVRTATVITNKANPTWEWGWYLRIDDAEGNKHYFAHCLSSSFRVKTGEKVQKGQVLARMGCSGNAALASPPIPHVHYEVRTAGNIYLNPCGFLNIPNAVGVQGGSFTEPDKHPTVNTGGAGLNLRTAPGTKYGIVKKLQDGERVSISERDGNWAYIGGGWVSSEYLKNI